MSMEDFFHLATRLISQMGFKIRSSVYREDVAVFDAQMPIPGKALHYVIVFFKRPVVRGKDLEEMLEESVEVRWMFVTTGEFEGVDKFKERDDITLMNSSDLKRLLREFGIEEEMERDSRGQEARKGSFLPSTGEYESLLQWSEEFLNSGNYRMALDYAEKALGIKITPQGLKLKARILSKMGEIEKAIEILKEILEENVEDDEAWLLLGEVVEDESPEDAEAAYARCLKFNPRNLACWISRGNALLTLGRYNEALVCYDRALAIRNDLPMIWNNRGIALKHMGKYDEALRSYNMALDIDPKFKDAHLNKAILYFDLRRYEEAQNSLREVLSLEENDIPALLLLAKIHLKRNMEGEAREILNRILTIDPVNLEAREILRRLEPKESPEIYSHKGYLHLLYEMGKLDMPDGMDYNALGLLLMDRGEYELASLHFRIASIVNPDFKEARLNLARALEKLGKKREAREILKELD